MKNRKNNFIKLGIFLFGISLFLWNCQKDDSIELPQVEIIKSPFKVRTIKLTEIPKVRDFLIEKTNETLFNRNSDYNRAIFDNDNILEVIDTLDYTNYTFRFTFPDTPIGEFYNLVVGKTANDENVTPYVLKYKCDETQLSEFIGNNFNFSYFKGTVARHKYTDFFELGSVFLRTDTETNCPSQNDENGDPIACDNSSVDGSITGGGSGGGNGDGDNDGSGDSTETGSSTGSSSSGSGSCVFAGFERIFFDCPPNCDCTSCSIVVGVYNCPVLSRPTNTNSRTTTTTCPDCPSGNGGVGVLTDGDENEESESLSSNCKKLKKLSNSPSFQQRMQEIIPNTTGNTEIGYWDRKDFTGDMNYNTSDRFESQPNVREIRPSAPTTPIDSYIHNHFNNGQGSLPVFSGSDLYTLYQLYINGHINNLSSFVMIVATPGNTSSPNDDTVYAITISNGTEFANWANILSIDPFLVDRLYGDIRINQNISTALNEKRLAKLFKENKMGMNIYRGDKNDLSKWTRLKIRDNGDLKEDNCN